MRELNDTKGKSPALSLSLALLQPLVDASLDMTLVSQVLYHSLFKHNL